MRKVFVEPVVLPEPRFRDGLGIRYVRTDTSEDPVEILRPLWDIGAMQTAIRQRVSRLATFRQARFVALRGAEVPADDPTTIEIISDHLPGYRLSQLLEAIRAGNLTLESTAAIYIVRELLGALAVLHESRGVTHGAVGPERILITPKGRVVVADYVLGPAIERLEFTRTRLWREFRVPCAPGKGAPRFDDAADVLQVGMTALALFAGRPIESPEYPDGVDDLLSSVAQAQAANGRAVVPAPLVGWLRRSLRKENGSQFAHVREARLALEAVLSKHEAFTGGAAALKSLAEEFGRQAAAIEADAAASRARSAALDARAEVLDASGALLPDDEAPAASDTDSVPAFELLPASDASAEAGAGTSASMLQAAPDDDGDTEAPVGWRVPEPVVAEETLPTSPLLQMAAPEEAPGEDGFVEEVLDLGGLVDDDDGVRAAEEAAVTEEAAQAVETLPPEPPPAEEGTALCAAADVEPSETSAVEAPAAVCTVDDVEARGLPAVEEVGVPTVEDVESAEPPLTAETTAIRAAEAVVETQGLEDAPVTDAVRSFLDEILTPHVAGVESQPPGDAPAGHIDEPAGDIAAPDAPMLEGLRTRGILEDLLRVYPRIEETAAVEEPLPTADAAAPGPEAIPALPADWYVEVEAGVVKREADPAVAPLPATAEGTLTARVEEAPPAPTEAEPAAVPSAPDVQRRREARQIVNRNEPIFPRVSPSVQRVRAEARRRRLARLRSGAAQGLRAAGRGCAAAVSATARAVAGMFAAGGRAVLVTTRAAVRLGLAASTGVVRGCGAALRGVVSGLASALKIAGGAGAAVARGSVTAAALAGSGVIRAGRAAASVSGTAFKTSVRLAARGLRGAGGVAAAALRTASRGAVVTARVAGAAATRVGRGTGAALAAAGRAAQVTAAGVVRVLGACGTVTAAAARWIVSATAGCVRGTGVAAARVAASTATAAGRAARASIRVGTGVAKVAAEEARRLYFAGSDIAEHVPRPVLRPWYLAAALLVIVAAAGVPFARAHWFAPTPAVGVLRVESARPGLLVRIDGEPAGQTPLSATIAAGKHRVEVDGTGKARVHDVDVTAGRATVVRAGGAALRGTGSIRLASEPDGAEVWLDGVLHGTSPLTIGSVTEGTHTVMVRDASGTVRQTVQVRANETAEATVQIRPGWLAVFAPVRLDILEAGLPVGSTERGRILMPPGEHTLELVGEAFGFRQTCRVQVKPGDVAALTVQMPPAALEVVAPAESEIFVDGQLVGKAPLEPVRVAVGTREVLMRHPAIGERRQVITITYASANRVAFE